MTRRFCVTGTSPRCIASILSALVLASSVCAACSGREPQPQPAGAATQPAGRQLTEQELRDMVVGSMLQASRGNDTAAALKRLDEAIAQGKTFRMVAFEDVPDEWVTVVPAGMGGGGAWEHVIDRTEQQTWEPQSR